ERLDHLAAAAEVGNLEIEPVLFEDAELVTDIDGNDGVRGRVGLADDQRRLGESRGRSREGEKRSNRRDGAQTAAPSRYEHEISSPRLMPRAQSTLIIRCRREIAAFGGRPHGQSATQSR